MPRILTLLSESNPEENEVKSEAQFQKFVASFSNHPRTPRALLDRGRYPEEAGGDDEFTREDSPSDDEDDPGTAGPFSYSNTGSEPVNIPSSTTPAHSVNGDDFGLSESPSNNAMDIDTVSFARCIIVRDVSDIFEATLLDMWFAQADFMALHPSPHLDERCSHE